MRSYSHNEKQQEFARRLRRIETLHLRQGGRLRPDWAGRHPWRAALIGFGWCYVALLVIQRYDRIESALAASPIPASWHMPVLGFLAATLILSGALLVMHIARYMIRARMFRHSGGTLAGASMAMALVLTPPSVLSQGFELLDDNTRQAILAARTSVTEIDWIDLLKLRNG